MKYIIEYTFANYDSFSESDEEYTTRVVVTATDDHHAIAIGMDRVRGFGVSGNFRRVQMIEMTPVPY